MTLEAEDIRAAVSAGVISEDQAIKISALSQSRKGLRDHMGAQQEPFELFKGFNEIFIVVGLVILFSGWFGLTELSVLFSDSRSTSAILYAAISLVGLAFLARYFTLKRRMMGPSNALVVLFLLSSVNFASPLAGMLDQGDSVFYGTLAAITGLLMLVYWLLFKVPFALPFVALSVYITAFCISLSTGAEFNDIEEIFLLSTQGPFAFLTLGLGLIGLVFAMRFDMKDPHRVTLMAQNAFWLHIIAAPAIVNTVAMSLYQAGGLIQTIGLLVFLTAMALFAVVIDRRSFLMAGIGYVVALIVTVLKGDAFMLVMILGASLVLLGAQWEKLRATLMNALPQFPGKERLPPYSKKETV